MKKNFLLVLLFLAISSVAFAQNLIEDPFVVAQNQTEKMKMDLGLRPEQIDSVYGINLKYAQYIQNLETSGLQPQSINGQKQKLKSARMKELKNVLDEDQMGTYRKEMLEEKGNKQNVNAKGKAKGSGKGRK